MGTPFEMLYGLSMRAYRSGIGLAAPFNRKAKSWITGRRDQEYVSTESPPIWIHCSSLGEFEQGRPIIERLRERHPQVPLVLTFFSPSGFEIRADYKQVNRVYYLPVDLPTEVSRFLDVVKPRLAIFVKYEFWYHQLRELHRRDVPYIFIAAIFRKNHFLFRQLLKPVLDLVRKSAMIFVQTAESKSLLEARGISHCVTAGDPRIDRVLAIESMPMQTDRKTYSETVILGSLWMEDLDVLLTWLKELISRPGVQVILAPHDISPRNLKAIAHATGIQKRYSDVKEQGQPWPKVFLLDTMGHLSRLYHSATLAYIGGGFGHGIHNILEPAAAGIPIIFGPKYQKFSEARDLIETGCAFSISSKKDLTKAVLKLEDDQIRKKIKDKLKIYLEENKGAPKIIVDWIEERGFFVGNNQKI